MVFFDKVLESVRQIMIDDVVYDIYNMPKGFCPFHNDRHAGSFNLNKKFNRYHCFSCGENGDAIDFTQKQENVGFTQAVWKLALEFEISTLEQMEACLNGKSTDEEVKRPPRVYDGFLNDAEEYKIADTDVLHNVYSLFAEGESLLKKNHKVSTPHIEHLKSERKLSIEEIERAGYFTIPRRSKYFMREFLKELKERFGYEEEVLNEVPGFYHVGRVGGMTFVSHKGIGIPVKNEKKEIVGIQIRRDDTTIGGQRYVWFSSSFANEKEGMSMGTGSGSPIHVSYPKKNNRPESLYITEGIFKAEQLSRYFKATCISVQGVHSWKGKINKYINHLEEVEGQGLLDVHVIFDADVSENINVYLAFREMYLTLKDEFPMIKFVYHWWEQDYGKGVDDMILAGFGSEIMEIDCQLYVNAYDKLLKDAQRDYALPLKELEKELIAYEYEQKIAPLFQINH